MINPKEMTTIQLDEASANILGYNGIVRKDGFYYIEKRKVKGMLKKWNPTGDITQAWPIIVDNHIDIIAPRPHINIASTKSHIDNLWLCQVGVIDNLTIVTRGADPLVEAIRVFVMKNINSEGYNGNQ